MHSFKSVLLVAAVGCLSGCGEASGSSTSTTSAYSDDAGAEGGIASTGLPGAPAILQGICLQSDSAFPVPLDDINLAGGVLNVNLSGNAVRVAHPFKCNFTQSIVDATGHVKVQSVVKASYPSVRVDPQGFTATLNSAAAPGVVASTLDLFLPDAQQAVFSRGTAEYLVTLGSDGPRAAAVNDPSEDQARAALDKLTQDDLNVSDPSDVLDVVRPFISAGKSSLSLAAVVKVADNLALDHDKHASAHFVLGDRVSIMMAGKASLGIVVGVRNVSTLVDPIDVLVVDASNRLTVHQVVAADNVSLVAGVQTL